MTVWRMVVMMMMVVEEDNDDSNSSGLCLDQKCFLDIV